ncbi:DEAD/DEAH box helicase [Saccharibacillus sacchari]|uniref:DEAD/DEAH box helicase n=1 Tax=Saccharibacillus sacchari TaxID=456493 RepID=UPI0004B0225A|nr:3'-5' exonuclease [Saccharibacillus sacchari]
MAYMIPETLPRGAKVTAGERLLFGTLKEHLPDDYIVYYEPRIFGRCPDFVVIGPDLGMLVLEVKDYTESTLYELFPEEWRIYNKQGEVSTVINPLHQARNYAFRIASKLKKDKSLVQLEGVYRGNLKFRFGFGVVFTQMRETHIVKHQLHRVIEPQFMLTRDDIKAIRYHLFPEVRISAEYKPPVHHDDQLLLSLHNLRAMDLHQEALARQLGDKNRLIRGVAGSGKTLILSARARLLSKEHPDWKILVLCYGIPLSRVLKSMIHNMTEEPEDLFDFAAMSAEESGNPAAKKHNIETATFHEWLKNTLRIPDAGIEPLLEKVKLGEAILPTYDAILIDEGQDFEPSWLELLSKVLNPETQSLLLVEDKAQNIFRRKSSLSSSTGLDFRGRSKILSINYRNTAQIVNFAWDFYRTHSALKDRVKEGSSVDGVEIIPPQSTKRKGPEPIIKQCANFNEEAAWVARAIRKLHEEKKVPYSEIAILYRVRNRYSYSYVDRLRKELDRLEIPHDWIAEDVHSKRAYDRTADTVKLSTIDSSKGLDFRAVFIVNVESMPFKFEENVEREVSLFYIGMTRAMEWLFLSYCKAQGFAGWLCEANQSKDMTNELKNLK